jgi:hypothetical protein
LKVPPEEQFWKRHSPHGEAPLSMAGSIALHALAIGGLVLCAVYLAALFLKPERSLPIDPVRLLPGGDGRGAGKEPAGAGQGGEDVGAPDKESQPGDEDGPRRPALTPIEAKKLQEEFDPDSFRAIQRSETGKALARLGAGARDRLRKGIGSGDGQPGKGPGPGPGGRLNKREKRMLRWHMRFTANTGSEYLEQLRQLGAILAFPVTEGAEPKFKVVRDLKPGGNLKDEDLSKIQRIYWIDDKPKSVTDILGALRIRLPRLPARFVAFMPEELEKQLFNMERRYVEKVLKRKFDEDKIDETEFRVVHTAKGYLPELIRVTMRR